MTSRHLVDPELLPLVDAFDALALGPVSADTLAYRRELILPFEPRGEDNDVAIETRMVPGPAGAPDVGLRILRPGGAAGPLPVIYHIHGGGYVMGKVEGGDAMNRSIAAELGCAIVSVDYRLAPETPYPGPLDDCYAGLAWLFAHAEAEGFDPSRIGVKGESAGGGLAAALALLARDRGEHRLAFQHLIYPMLDDRTGSGVDPHRHVGEFVWQVESNRFGWASLLGRAPGGADVPAYAAPARAADLAGLPPTFLYTVSLDLFRDENIDYARRLLDAGVPTEFHILPGAFHAFELQSDAAIARQAQQLTLSALRRFLAPRN